MDIFLTGQLDFVSSSFCESLSKRCRIVASSKDLNTDYIGGIYKSFLHEAGTEAYARLFNIYSFHAVVYFAGRPELGKSDFSDLDRLHKVLELCAQYNVAKVIYISSSYIYNGIVNATEDSLPAPLDDAGVLLASCEQMCSYYRDKKGLSIMCLHTPVLFGNYEDKSLIGKMVYQAVVKNYVVIDKMPQRQIDFLSQEDLSELVFRILVDWNEEITLMNLPGAMSMTLPQLAQHFGEIVHSTRITYTQQPYLIYPPTQSAVARSIYDWVPVLKISEEIPTLVENIHREDKKKTTFKQRMLNILHSKSIIYKTIELVLGYFLMEYLNYVTTTAVQFRYVDFRLLYVVILAIANGLKSGLVAALLACFSCVMAYMSGGMDWHVLLYNIDNWLPFACYILAGAVIGYTKDKKDKDLAFISEEKDIVDKRYAFLTELYQNALQSKNQYKNQIMSYRNSFGRIFEVTRKLNTLTPDAVFKEALFILEDILDNQSISIYNITSNQNFARLNVCSKKIFENMPKSLDLKNYQSIMQELKPGEVWVNTQCNNNYPDYVFPVFRGETPVSLIMVNKAASEQMEMYFENLIKILCNMIEDSLIRAQDYAEKFKDEFYIPGSCVLTSEAFKNILAVWEQMSQDAISEYSLIRINANDSNIVSLAQRLRSSFRENDVFGQGDDGNLYILLALASKDTSEQVIQRLKKQGVID